RRARRRQGARGRDRQRLPGRRPLRARRARLLDRTPRAAPRPHEGAPRPPRLPRPHPPRRRHARLERPRPVRRDRRDGGRCGRPGRPPRTAPRARRRPPRRPPRHPRRRRREADDAAPHAHRPGHAPPRGVPGLPLRPARRRGRRTLTFRSALLRMASPTPPRHPRALLVHFGQGLLMGGADIIPGVSGGTMALIVGIYERLIASVKAGLTLPVTLLRGWDAAKRQFFEVEWRLVLPLAAGILTAIVLASKFIPYLLDAYPAESRGLFFGLIAASLLIPWRRMETVGTREYALIALGAALAFFLTGLPGLEVHDPSLLRVFLSAAVAICAMILPG